MISPGAIPLSVLTWALPGIPFPYPSSSVVRVTIHLSTAALLPRLVDAARQDSTRTRIGRYQANAGKTWRLHGLGGLLDCWQVLQHASSCWIALEISHALCVYIVGS